MKIRAPGYATLAQVIVEHGTDKDKRCLAEIALYRANGVSSPELEAVMIKSAELRNSIDYNLPMEASDAGPTQ